MKEGIKTGMPARIRHFLLPFSPLYRGIVTIRNVLFDAGILKSVRFPGPVISVGNITVGGTGKTPHVEYLVALLKDRVRIAVLSRGYKRKSKGFLLLTEKSNITQAGDEPLQISRKFPDIYVAVDRSRVDGIGQLMLLTPSPDVVVLDDAFQHRHVNPGLSILLVDHSRPVFNDRMLPAGNLREPWKNVERADLVVVTKCPAGMDPSDRLLFTEKLRRKPEQAVYFTTYRYGDLIQVFKTHQSVREPLQINRLRNRNTGVLLITGIANPAPLRDYLKAHINVSDEMTYADHHLYTPKDLALMHARYQKMPGNRKYILVTEKDAVRLKDLHVEDGSFKRAFYYIPVEVQFLFNGGPAFDTTVYDFLKRGGKVLSL